MSGATVALASEVGQMDFAEKEIPNNMCISRKVLRRDSCKMEGLYNYNCKMSLYGGHCMTTH